MKSHISKMFSNKIRSQNFHLHYDFKIIKFIQYSGFRRSVFCRQDYLPGWLHRLIIWGQPLLLARPPAGSDRLARGEQRFTAVVASFGPKLFSKDMSTHSVALSSKTFRWTTVQCLCGHLCSPKS